MLRLRKALLIATKMQLEEKMALFDITMLDETMPIFLKPAILNIHNRLSQVPSYVVDVGEEIEYFAEYLLLNNSEISINTFKKETNGDMKIVVHGNVISKAQQNEQATPQFVSMYKTWDESEFLNFKNMLKKTGCWLLVLSGSENICFLTYTQTGQILNAFTAPREL